MSSGPTVVLGILPADRPDSSGRKIRFEGFLPLTPAAVNGGQLCAFAFGMGSKDLDCRENVSTTPHGFIDTLNLDSGITQVSIAGWAYDPDTADPVVVQAFTDGVFSGQALANLPRPDITGPDSTGHISATYGINHGFSFTIPPNPAKGVHTVCALVSNVGLGSGNQQIDCKQYRTPGPPTAPEITQVTTDKYGPSISLVWQDRSDDEDSFIIKRSVKYHTGSRTEEMRVINTHPSCPDLCQRLFIMI